MKTITKYVQVACLFSLLIAGAGCTKEENTALEGNSSNKVIITGSIENAVSVQSRVDEDQFGSYLNGGFSKDDQIGFYSENNNEGGTPGFANLCLTYTSKNDGGYQTFTCDELGDTPSNWGDVFAYYPYSDTNAGDNINIYNDEGKAIDLLTAHSAGLSGGLIHFTFTHTFSMLFIIPGEQGFKNAIEKNKTEGVKVVLKQGIANATVNPGRTGITLNKTNEAPKEFTAVANTEAYTINGELYEDNTFFYVLLPSETEVDSIKIIDDFGKTQYVRPTSAQLPRLARGTRYPITVYMQGDEPTLWPWKFTDWGDQIIIEEDREKGIYENDLEGWIQAYNAYCEAGRPEPEEGADAEKVPLLRYGDYNKEEGEEGKWTFLLKADIDCSQLFTNQGGAVSQLISTFQDELNGQNHTLFNLTLSDGIIGTLSRNGRIENLKLENVTITSTTAEAPRGGIVNEMSGGTITNCEVNNLRINAQGPAGAIAGKITGGSITGNTCNGILIGTESVSDETHGTYIIGTYEGETITVSGNPSNVIFQSNNLTE